VAIWSNFNTYFLGDLFLKTGNLRQNIPFSKFLSQNGKFSSQNKSLAQGYCLNMVISKMFSLKFNYFGTFFSQKFFV
jgi:hypothetical protein